MQVILRAAVHALCVEAPEFVSDTAGFSEPLGGLLRITKVYVVETLRKKCLILQLEGPRLAPMH